MKSYFPDTAWDSSNRSITPSLFLSIDSNTSRYFSLEEGIFGAFFLAAGVADLERLRLLGAGEVVLRALGGILSILDRSVDKEQKLVRW